MLAGGVREIIAADPLPTRLKTAQRLGAHTLIQAQSDSPGKPVNSIQPINGLDAAIDFTGGPALEEASASIHPGGILVAGALTYPADLMKRVTGQCANRKIQLVSPSEKGPDSRLVETVEYSFTNKHVIVWPIISHVIPFREADRAYRQILDDPDRTIQVILSYD